MNRLLITILIATFFIAFNTKAQDTQPATFTGAVERQFNKIESDILSTAEAMPADKYNFSPEMLHINGADFKGARTFAGQIMHLATDNILIWSAITGDEVRSDITDVNGPPSINTKAEVIKYLKDSFAIGRKAIAMLNEKTVLELIDFRYRKLSRLDLAFYGLTHSNEHYGQMALYLRMNGIIPPPTINEH